MTNPSFPIPPFSTSQNIQGLYRHHKGNLYRVLGKATHSETLEDHIVYQALYGEGETWIRPASLFFGTVSVQDKMVPRFMKIDGEPS